MEIIGELVQHPLEVGTTSRPRFLRICSTDISTPRVWAPASDYEPQLTLRAMTVGRRSRAARWFSAGIRRSSAQ